MDFVQEIIHFYNRVAPIIKNGRSRLYQHIGLSWQHPQGAQAVLRTSLDNRQALLVAHAFAKPLPGEIVVDLPSGNWRIVGAQPAKNIDLQINGNKLGIQPTQEFKGYIIHLENG